MATRQPAEESLLFDLPLDPAPRRPAPADEIEQAALPLIESQPDSEADEEAAPPAAGEVARPRAAPAASPHWRARAVAGLIDLGACATVAAGLRVALAAMGVELRPADWPAGAVFLLAFSFLFFVLPLAFWGRTPGMAAAGLRARSRDGRPLTFRQAVLRWLAAVLTVAAAGLPALLALGERSLGDRLSDSLTRRQPPRR